MNKFQRKEARGIHRMLTYSPIPYHKDPKYKIVRRNFRKMARILSKRNKQAHKKALSKAVNDYVRQDVFNTICVAKAIEVKNE